MISEEERAIILKCAEKYNVSSIYLFGSSIRTDAEPRDIDIGVKGLRPYTQGETYEEVLENIKDAIRLHVEDRLEAGEEIPEAESVSLSQNYQGHMGEP